MTRYNCNNRDEKFAQIALREADKSTMQQNHGCVAVMGGRVVAKGFNSDRCYSSDGFLLNTCSCHAEIDVLQKLHKSLLKKGKLQKADKLFRKTTLYISRFKENSDTYNSAPCLDCLIMIQKFNIKRIIFYQDNTCHIVNPKKYITTHRSYGQIFINNLD